MNKKNSNIKICIWYIYIDIIFLNIFLTINFTLKIYYKDAFRIIYQTLSNLNFNIQKEEEKNQQIYIYIYINKLISFKTNGICLDWRNKINERMV